MLKIFLPLHHACHLCSSSPGSPSFEISFSSNSSWKPSYLFQALSCFFLWSCSTQTTRHLRASVLHLELCNSSSNSSKQDRVFFLILSLAPESEDLSTNRSSFPGLSLVLPTSKVQFLPEPDQNMGNRGNRRTKLGVSPGQTPCPGNLRVLSTQHRVVFWVLNTQHCAQGMDGLMDRWIDGWEQGRHNPCPHGA